MSEKTSLLSFSIALLIAASALAAAWGFQVIGGYIPCDLCLQQRVPYYVGLPIGVVAFLLIAKKSGHNTKIFFLLFVLKQRHAAKLFILLFCLTMAASAALGIYHAGAEWNFWEGPLDCGGAMVIPESTGSLLAQMQDAKLVSCKDAAGRFLGISFAGWNVVACLASISFAARALRS